MERECLADTRPDPADRPRVVGRCAAQDGEWFSVPAIFPLTQFYYVAMATPAVVGRPVLAALLALPVHS